MKHSVSAFYSDTIKLNIIDLFKLIIGKELKGCGLTIGLWKTPKKG